MKRLSQILAIVTFLASLSLPAIAYEEKPWDGPEMTAPASQAAPVQTASLVMPFQENAAATITSAQAEPFIIPFHENEVASQAVERNIILFSDKIRDRFTVYLSRSGSYLDMMKEILRKKDVPEDIVFLSLIESGFNPNAYSVAHAAGPWQFIASTAKRYGLEIDWWKDERRDPVKSTAAAADYLKDLYGMFGSWNLAMAAYNAGEGRIMKAMRRSNADDYWDLLGTTHIRPETKEYVPRFIAASMIAANPQEFGFGEIEYRAPMSYEEVELAEPVDLAVAAQCAETTVEEIKRLNPELRRWCTPPDAPLYTLRVPEGTRELFLDNLASIPEDERFTIDHYKVRKGDTFRSIGKKTGIPVEAILSLNATEKIMPLKSGTTIYLPPKGLFSIDKIDKASMKKASYRKVRASASVSGKKKGTPRKNARAKSGRSRKV
jgi:membrane-bound lytic murein transglycosylase D